MTERIYKDKKFSMLNSIADKCIKKLTDSGVEKSQVKIEAVKKNELCSHTNDIDLYKTGTNYNLEITVIKNAKMGYSCINNIDEDDIANTLEEVVELTANSDIDTSNDISDFAPFKHFQIGEEEFNFSQSVNSLKDFISYVAKKHPYTILREMIIDFHAIKGAFLNSNGRKYNYSSNYYDFLVKFASKKGLKVSSFNTAKLKFRKFPDKLYAQGNIEQLISHSEIMTAQPISDNFIGDVIITPDCFSNILHKITDQLSDSQICSKVSFFSDKLNKSIASDLFYLSVNPVNHYMAENQFITSDGYEAQNKNLIENGILKSFLTTDYSFKKMGIENPKTINMNYVVKNGDNKLSDIIKKVDRGILLYRFSGGHPAQNGDFSGIAKNSFYIENGVVKYPLSETMISGNIFKMLNDIVSISSEVCHSGSYLIPWIQIKDLTVTGNTRNN